MTELGATLSSVMTSGKPRLENEALPQEILGRDDNIWVLRGWEARIQKKKKDTISQRNKGEKPPRTWEDGVFAHLCTCVWKPEDNTSCHPQEHGHLL